MLRGKAAASLVHESELYSYIYDYNWNILQNVVTYFKNSLGNVMAIAKISHWEEWHCYENSNSNRRDQRE